jgi:glycosyltransferase involved in cell wall biosynthesis
LYDSTIADGVRGEQLHLIQNAFAALQPPLSRGAARRELGVSPDEPVVGWVGRMLHVKGGDIFLRAIAMLPEPRPAVIMIAYGEQESALRELTAQLGLSETVRFHSNIPHAARLFPAFDTYVLSSRSEGLPIVLLEAMAARVPIVSTAVGGVPEAVGDDAAWLVPPEDPRALADAISTSLNDKACAASRVARASERLTRDFAVHPWLDRYEEVYHAARQHAGRDERVAAADHAPSMDTMRRRQRA